MRKSRKLIAILATLALLATLLVPMVGPAAAADPVTFTNAKATIEKADNQSLGWIKVSVDSGTLGVSGFVYATVELPTGVKYAITTGSVTDYTGSGAPADSIKSVSEQSLTVSKALDTAASAKTNIVFIFIKNTNSKVNISSSAADQITVKVTAKIIDNLGYQVGSTYTYDALVGEKATKEVTVTAATPVALQAGTTGNSAAKVTISESAAGSLALNDEIYFELPSSYFKWGTMTNPSGAYGLAATLSVDSNNSKKLILKVTGTSSLADSLKFTPVIDVYPGAPDGDVVVSVTSTSSKVKSGTVTIANIGAPTVTLSTKDTATGDVIVAKADQAVDDIVVSATGNIASGKSIVLELPSGFTFDTTTSTPGGTNLNTAQIYNDGKNAWITTSAAAKEYTISGIRIKAKASAPVGDLLIAVSGSAGASGSVKVATVVAPVTVTADKPNVVAGATSAAAGDITITETKNTSAATGKLKLTLPTGVKFADNFKFKVNNGSEQTTSDARGKDSLEIDVTLSGIVDTIKIYGIKYDVDTRVSGDIEVALGGTAINALAGDTSSVAKVINAVAVSATKRDASFVIGSLTYKVNGVEKTMDAAPYIKDGRTFLPVRFVADALGVASDNILWDGSKVTIIKGDRVVQLTIGDKVMLINGASITMDVAPEVVAPGRTMLPFRWIAQALGASVSWDEATQNVTMNIQ